MINWSNALFIISLGTGIVTHIFKVATIKTCNV